MGGGTGEQTQGGQVMSGPDNMTNRASGFDQAVKRVMDALDTLDAVLAQRFGNDHRGGAPGEQIQVFNIDRSRLASELDAVRARARELENGNREAVRRIDAAMSAIRAVIAANRN
jgi:acyl-coenzyme A thioesterase PaaI-like protein